MNRTSWKWLTVIIGILLVAAILASGIACREGGEHALPIFGWVTVFFALASIPLFALWTGMQFRGKNGPGNDKATILLAQAAESKGEANGKPFCRMTRTTNTEVLQVGEGHTEFGGENKVVVGDGTTERS